MVDYSYCSKRRSMKLHVGYGLPSHAYEIFKSFYFPSSHLLSFGEIGWVYLFTILNW